MKGSDMKWKAEFECDGPDQWSSNALVFDSKEEAEAYAKDLFHRHERLLCRWTVPSRWRVVEVEEKPA